MVPPSSNGFRNQWDFSMTSFVYNYQNAFRYNLCCADVSRYPGSQTFSKRRATKCDKRSGEERENRQEVRKPLVARDSWLILPHPASWLEEPYRCVVIGCLLIDLVMLIDTYRSMIVRFALPATRGFRSPLLSLSCLISSRWKKTSGTRVVSRTSDSSQKKKHQIQ